MSTYNKVEGLSKVKIETSKNYTGHWDAGYNIRYRYYWGKNPINVQLMANDQKTTSPSDINSIAQTIARNLSLIKIYDPETYERFISSNIEINLTNFGQPTGQISGSVNYYTEGYYLGQQLPKYKNRHFSTERVSDTKGNSYNSIDLPLDMFKNYNEYTTITTLYHELLHAITGSDIYLLRDRIEKQMTFDSNIDDEVRNQSIDNEWFYQLENPVIKKTIGFLNILKTNKTKNIHGFLDTGIQQQTNYLRIVTEKYNQNDPYRIITLKDY